MPFMIDDERRRLYDEVWAEPMLVVAKRYGLSYVGMAKPFRRAQIRSRRVAARARQPAPAVRGRPYSAGAV